MASVDTVAARAPRARRFRAGVISAAIILAATRPGAGVRLGRRSVFVSFLAGLLAPARFAHRQGLRLLTATNLLGAFAVAFTLLVNPERGYPLLALGGAALVAAFLYARTVRAGRSGGIDAVEREADAED
jgi:hypothetical protein